MSEIDTRHISRDSLFLLANLRFEGLDEERRVKVRNLSAGGVMAEGICPAERGARLAIELRNIGWVDGVIAWIQDDRFGIAFATEVDPKLARAPEKKSDFETPRFVRPSSLLPPSAQHDPHRLRKV